MRPVVKSLVYIRWTNSFVGSLIGVFVQLFLYQLFSSLDINIIATLVFFTGIMVGFCGIGYIASLSQFTIKHCFPWGFVCMGLSVCSFSFVSSINTAFISMFIWGIGQGIFSLAVNTFELSETVDSERDLYSSILNIGMQILALIGPAFATLLIWLSGTFLNLGNYTLLFIVSPIIYFAGLLFLTGITDYIPKQFIRADVAYFFTSKQNKRAHVYTAGTGLQQIFSNVVPPLALLFILGSTLRVGLYDTVFALFTALCIVVVARFRTPTNRLYIFGITTAGISLVTLYFGYILTFSALIIYTIIEGILTPINTVSAHVIELSTMNIGRDSSDFYATMILRDFFLWVWRCVGGMTLLVILHFITGESERIASGLYLLSLALLITFAGAYLLLKNTKVSRAHA